MEMQENVALCGKKANILVGRHIGQRFSMNGGLLVYEQTRAVYCRA